MPDRKAGQLIDSSFTPTSEFLEALELLSRTPRLLEEFSRRVPDLRMAPECWELILRKELLLLLAWAGQRLLLTSENKSVGSSKPDQIISLLPSTAFALHIIRRALPFAALGIMTFCGFPEFCLSDATEYVEVIAETFRIKETLRVHPSPKTFLRSFHKNDKQILIITGKRSTVKNLKGITSGLVLGAAGRCAVALGFARNSAIELKSALSLYSIPQSCSRLRATFSCEQIRDNSVVRAITNAHGMGSIRCLSEALKSLHPSIVFVSESEGISDYPPIIAGYRLFVWSHSGTPRDATGFGRDPVYGWPGDYWI